MTPVGSNGVVIWVTCAASENDETRRHRRMIVSIHLPVLANFLSIFFFVIFQYIFSGLLNSSSYRQTNLELLASLRLSEELMESKKESS